MLRDTPRRQMDSLWTKYFRDPSQWWDSRFNKIHQRSPDFRHKTTQEPLWIDGWHNSCWVREELSKRGMLLFNIEARLQSDTDSCALSNSFVASLKACSQKKDLHQAFKIDKDIRTSGLLEKNTPIGSMLVCLYVKCGAVAKAQQVLYELHIREVVPWNAVIAGYAKEKKGAESLECYKYMKSTGISPNSITYACILKACGIAREVAKGKQIHDEILNKGLLKNDIVLGTALVNMYVKCGAIAKAALVLDEMPVRDVVSWNALISGYTQQGQGMEALECCERMRGEGFAPDAVTYACTLKACGLTGEDNKGRQLHDEIVNQGLLGRGDVVLGNALVDMYAKCGPMAKAQEVLDKLPVRDTASWHSVIAGHVQQGQGEKALECYDRMRDEGLVPHPITYPCILRACGITRSGDRGKQIHEELVNQRLLERDVVLGNALVDMYAKCGVVARAEQVLDELPIRNVVTWNALIAGYVQIGQGEEAWDCFQRMQMEGLTPNIVSWSALIAGHVEWGQGRAALDCYEQMRIAGLVPNAVTYVCILKACGITQDIDKGQQIHDEIVRQGLLGSDIVLGTALIDMYAKCGAVVKSQEVFDKFPVRDIVSWSALIAGYAQQGQGVKALDCFQRMRSEGITPKIACWNALISGYAQQGLVEGALECFELMQREGALPDAITFVCVLNACSHSGLVNEGEFLFERMREIYGVTPDVEHCICMIDLFGRAGHFEKAMAVIEKMPSADHSPVWSALLGACRKWGNVKLGRLAFEHAVRLDECDAAAYILMTNIYAAAGMREEAQKIEAMRVQKTAWKKPGRSWWIAGNGDVHSFDVGDRIHAQ